MFPFDGDQRGESKLIEKGLTRFNAVDLTEEVCGGSE